MAIQARITPAGAGERSRLPSAALYARQAPILEPDEQAPNSGEEWHVIVPVRPDTAHVRAPRFLDWAGECVSAILIIAGRVFAYGFVHLA